MKKRIVSLLLTVVMIVGMVPIDSLSVRADEPNVFEIQDLQGLNVAADAINRGEWDTDGLTIILNADIGWAPSSDNDWDTGKFTLSIGTETYPFEGTFDGNGHTVWVNNQMGLFGYIENATIKNVIVEGRVQADEETGFAGGIAMKGVDSSFIDCENRAALSGHDLGGIVNIGNGVTLDGCINRGKVVSSHHAAGICNTGDSVQMKNCLNTGDIQAGDEGDAAGLYLFVRQGEAINCISESSVTVGDGIAVGAFLQIDKDTIATNLYVGGSLTFPWGQGYSIAGHGYYGEGWDHIYTTITGIDANSGLKKIPLTTVADRAEAIALMNEEAMKHEDWCRWNIRTPIEGEESIYLVRPFEGSGTKTSPYLIEDVDQLEWFAKLVNGLDTDYHDAYVTLVKDIGNDSDAFTLPIGTTAQHFKGVFDGGNHTVNLYINSGSSRGMFGYVTDATIKNVTVKGEANGSSVAGVVGTAINSHIENCRNDADISGTEQCAGIVNLCSNSEINGCINTGNVTSNFAAAGIVALIQHSDDQGGLIQNCINYGRVTTEGVINGAGGIVGAIDPTCTTVHIYNCANCGVIVSQGGLAFSGAGGITSELGGSKNTKVNIENCFIGGDFSGEPKGLLAAYSAMNSGVITYADIFTTFSGIKLIADQDEEGGFTTVSDLSEAATKLNLRAANNPDWRLWEVKDNELRLDDCYHNNCETIYEWKNDPISCTATVRCKDCLEVIDTDTCVEEDLIFVADTPGTCMTPTLGHYRAVFENGIPDSESEKNSAQGFLGYHVDRDRDGICDLCGSTEPKENGGLFTQLNGRLHYEIVDAAEKSVRIISDQYIPYYEVTDNDGQHIRYVKTPADRIIDEANEKLVRKGYTETSIETKYTGEMPILYFTEYAHSIYYITEIGDTDPSDSAKVPFEGCSGITLLELPFTLKQIGTYAFMGCSSLESVEIPSGVEKIYAGAFSDCTSLKEVIFRSSSPVTVPVLPDTIPVMPFDEESESLLAFYVPNSKYLDYVDEWLPFASIIYESGKKSHYIATKPTCSIAGHKEYFRNGNTYYKDKEFTEAIGDYDALYEWLNDYSESGGGIARLGHIWGDCCEDIVEGHYCNRPGCRYHYEPTMHIINDAGDACEECGAPCTTIYDPYSFPHEAWAFYAEFHDDGKPLDQAWYYFPDSVSLTYPLIAARESVRLIIADGVTVTSPRGYYLPDGCELEIYYQSDGQDKGSFEGKPCECYNPETYEARLTHLDENNDYRCDYCGKTIVSYIDETGELTYATDFEFLTNDMTELSDDWYIINDSSEVIYFENPIIINGDVSIILQDNQELCASRGIVVTEGNTLTIYSRSLGMDMGKLTTDETKKSSYKGAAGIGGNLLNPDAGDITICGGSLEIYGGSGAAGIGGGMEGNGGTVTVYNGYVYAEGGTGAIGVGGGLGSDSDGEFVKTGGTVFIVDGEGASHEHTFEDHYTYDETHHWYACTCAHTVVNFFGAHDYNTVTANGVTTYTCKQCGYKKEVYDKTGDEEGEIATGIAYTGISLTIDSDIYINFYMNLTEDAIENGTMTFRIGDRIVTVPGEDSMYNGKEKKYYFRTPLTALEMNEPVTATFHYNNIDYIQEYSVLRYITVILNGQDKEGNPYPDKMKTLARKIANYGYYAQIYLESIHKNVHIVDSGEGYIRMKHFSGIYDIDVDSAKEALAGYGLEESGASENLSLYGRTVYFDSATALNYYVVAKAGNAPTAVAENIVTGETKEVEIKPYQDNIFIVSVKDIEATELSDSIVATINNEITLTSSVLSYCNSVITAHSFDGASEKDSFAVNAMAAFYEYHLAALEYASYELCFNVPGNYKVFTADGQTEIEKDVSFKCYRPFRFLIVPDDNYQIASVYSEGDVGTDENGAYILSYVGGMHEVAVSVTPNTVDFVVYVEGESEGAPSKTEVSFTYGVDIVYGSLFSPGRFIISDIPKGATGTISVSRDGYETYTQSYTADGQTPEVDVVLTPTEPN